MKSLKQQNRNPDLSRSADGAAKMKKKLMADIRAAVMLIVTENRTALQTLVRDATSLLSRPLGVRRYPMLQDKKH